MSNYWETIEEFEQNIGVEVLAKDTMMYRMYAFDYDIAQTRKEHLKNIRRLQFELNELLNVEKNSIYHMKQLYKFFSNNLSYTGQYVSIGRSLLTEKNHELVKAFETYYYDREEASYNLMCELQKKGMFLSSKEEPRRVAYNVNDLGNWNTKRDEFFVAKRIVDYILSDIEVMLEAKSAILYRVKEKRNSKKIDKNKK